MNRKKENIDTIAVSFSGGRASAYIAYLILTEEQNAEYDKVFVFANTGKEREETLEFAGLCGQYFGMNLAWLEAVVYLEKASSSELL